MKPSRQIILSSVEAETICLCCQFFQFASYSYLITCCFLSHETNMGMDVSLSTDLIRWFFNKYVHEISPKLLWYFQRRLYGFLVCFQLIDTGKAITYLQIKCQLDGHELPHLISIKLSLPKSEHTILIFAHWSVIQSEQVTAISPNNNLTHGRSVA